jgi:ABC-type lipoprotein export system ATPase subunit
VETLKANALHKSYGKRKNQVEVLKGISFSIQAGEFVGIMGPSGSGKTTLLNVLCSIDQPTSGTVTVNNQLLSKLSNSQLSQFRRTQMGFIFQDYHLLDTLTVKENILLPLAVSKVSKEDAEARVQHLMKELDIAHIAAHYPNEISGGQKQRTAAARALIMNPAIVFGDEPTGALDSKSAAALLDKLSQLNETEKMTIAMVTHDAVAASYCSRVLFLKDGKLYSELYKGAQSRQQFFEHILSTQAVLGGESHEA